MVELTRGLIAIPTEDPPGRHYADCVEFLETKLRQFGLDCRRVEIPTKTSDNEYPRYCLLASYGTGSPTVYFHGHYDVVPAASREQFRPVEMDGNLYGRGSADMKGGLVSMMYAVKAFIDCDIELNGRIGLVFVPDEETGGVHGAQYVFEQGLAGKDGIAAFTAEPTSGVIWNANRGAISLRVTVYGKPAHVALHYEGINAFDRMLTVVNALRELKREVETRQTAFNIQPDEARNSILMIGGQIGGGMNFNTLPDRCWFTLDRRINPEEDLAIESARLFQLFDRLRKDGLQIDIEILQEGKSAGTPEDDPAAKTLGDAVATITGNKPVFEMCPGLLETRFYVQKGIPAFGYGPGLLEVAHGPDEYVRVDNIVDCAAVYALAAANLLKQ